ncbi:alkaline phosphatase D family protein [Chromobacterium piscinae]|uniref:alkaline phosphatase D family protein n=1 Tax=Chromobacterium piscinae TaxID=686831 RepID=UPI001E56A428|nr:alkaline phosphatase D family protein [Chromobacterium piscinae]MCD5328238.1 alkaline phosphatase D family protein [Chromobacterium piscinae]
MDRRNFIKTALAGSGGLLLGPAAQAAPALITPDRLRPQASSGIQIGDVGADRAIVWARADRAARMLVEWDVSERFANPRKLRGPWATEAADFTTRIDLSGLPAGEQLFVRVCYEDAASPRALSEPLLGRFRTASRQPRDLRFVWSGDTAGQGFGINPDCGGMRIYETMRRQQPDFFVHCGDTIYADGPMAAEMTVEEGKIWRNLVTPEVSKVAETLDEYRGRYRYNLMDHNVRRFAAEVPQIWQWDDHEVVNNWSDSKNLADDARYREKSIGVLQARATRAFMEYAPLRHNGDRESERVYRHLPQGPLLDVFVVDMRSYRDANGANLQAEGEPGGSFMGREQLQWLLEGLKSSRAVWKAVMADMPLALQVGDGKNADGSPRWEAMANGDHGQPRGRELELAWLLREIKRHDVRNVVWFTADVHYTAAHHYHPERAAFADFNPFWEFVSGPLNAGTFGPNALDMSFGPKVVYQKAPPAQNASPLAGMQFFGQVDIDARSRAMTVRLKDVAGQTLFSQELPPA